MSLVKSFGTAMRAVSSRRPTSRASERKALCCTGIPSESSYLERGPPQLRHRRVCHWLPVLPLPEGLSCAPGVPDPTLVHMVVHRLWVCRVVAEGVSLREAGLAP